MSLVTFFVQEFVAPFAADQRQSDRQTSASTIASAFNRDLTVSAPLPGGGKQITVATAYEQHSQALLHVTLIQYDAATMSRRRSSSPIAPISAADRWVLENASLYRFNPDGTIITEPHVAQQQVELGEKPTDIVKRLSQDDPENLSRAEIAQIVHSGQLTQTRVAQVRHDLPGEARAAVRVLRLRADRDSVRHARGASGGGTSVGFGLAVAIVFVYYIVLTVFSFISQAFIGLAPLWAWMPNIIFTAIGWLDCAGRHRYELGRSYSAARARCC